MGTNDSSITLLTGLELREALLAARHRAGSSIASLNWEEES